jgi:hypothetical protein
MTVLTEFTPHRAMVDGQSHDVAGVRFRFTDCNPLTRKPYACSRWWELPYLIGWLLREELQIPDVVWDCLVSRGSALDMVGPWEYRVPFTLDATAVTSRRIGRPPEDACREWWDSGLDVDTDTSMTGVTNAVFVCECIGDWV